jgi:hypothetical protein
LLAACSTSARGQILMSPRGRFRMSLDTLRAALERLGRAIDEEARKGQGEDWSLMVGYVQSCLEKLPGAIDEWQED